jgi:aminopeptidase N
MRCQVAAMSLFVTCFLSSVPTAATAEEQAICRFHRHGVLGQDVAQAGFGLDLPGEGRRYAPDRVADILHIRLDVTPDFSKRTVSGTTTIAFQPIAQPLTELKLNAVDLTIHAVESKHAIQDFVNTGEYLIIRFQEPIAVATEASVAIQHSAQPAMGLYFRTPEMGYPETDTHVWTQGESHEARFWFPCFDYPNERSSTEVICHVPADMTVLSNGRKVAESIESNGLKRVHWLQEKPHVNYLICLVAGYFEKLEKKHRDIPLGFYVQPSLAAHAANSFADTDQIMEFYEQEIGVPFPWEKYDQVTIHDFIAGGMENTTLTTLTHNTIFSSETENLYTTRGLDAHELAHQWFGDYLTCKDWSHLWLNEGFATYYTHLYEGHKFGRDAMLYGLYEDASGDVLPKSNDKRGIVFNEYKNPGEQFDYRAYPKGSWVLHMLRSQVGPDLFRACIRHYLQQHALDSVVSDDLRQAFEEITGRPFDQFFDQWVYHGGSPDVKVRYEWQTSTNLAKVTVTQTHETNDDIRLFQFPTKLRFYVGNQVIDHDVMIDEREHEFYVPLPAKPDVVRFDPEYSVLASIDFDKPTEMWLKQSELRDDMLGRLFAAKALGSRKTHDSIGQLKKLLQSDHFHGVRIAASQALRQMGSDDAYVALTECRDQKDARVRRQVVSDIASFYRPETKDQMISILQHEKNPAIQSVAIRALGKFHDEQSQEWIVKSLSLASFQNRLADAAVDAIGDQMSTKLGQPVIDVLAARQSEFTTRGLGAALVTLARISRGMEDRSAIRLVIEPYLHDLRSPVRRGAIRALGELGDPAAIAVLESMSQTKGDRELAKSAEDALARLREAKPFVPEEVAELRKQLSEVKDANESLKKDLASLREVVEAIRKEDSLKREQVAPESESEVADRVEDAAESTP